MDWLCKKCITKKVICVKCNKHRKFKIPKLSYSFDKTLVVSIISNKCDSNDEKVF